MATDTIKKLAKKPAAKGRTKGRGKKAVGCKSSYNRITADLGHLFFTMTKVNGRTLVGFSIPKVDSDVWGMVDFAADKCGVDLRPEYVFDPNEGISGDADFEVTEEAFKKIRKWADDNGWTFTRPA